jgi:tetratricopeptide (TPR) repeat protein
MSMKRTFRGTLLAAFALTVLHPFNMRADQSPAYVALMHGRVEEATNLLRQAIAADASDGRAHLLLCRTEYAQDRADAAVTECEKAASAMPNDSDAQMWLGRALGMKASTANPLAAFGIARRVRSAFEKAVQLDPANVYAASDLGQYYIAAPAIVGGGDDKLLRLAARLKTHSPARYHRLLALLSQKNKDFEKAEAEFKLAVAAGKSPEAYTDLALFYQQQNRPDEAAAAGALALEADRSRSTVEFDVASILIAAKRSPEVAERAMRNYLSSPNQSDEAPVFKVHLELGKLLASRGNRAGAKAEYAAAVALAPNYEPARKALGGV